MSNQKRISSQTGLDGTVTGSTITRILEKHAVQRSDSEAFIFINGSGEETDNITYKTLYHKAIALSDIIKAQVKTGERVLLVYQPCIEFYVAFFACLYAAVIAVPVIAPRRGKLKRSTKSVIDNAQPVLTLTSGMIADEVRSAYLDAGYDSRIILSTDMNTDESLSDFDYDRAASEEAHTKRAIDEHSIAFLQYTSGSTSDPKGVMVSHANLIANLQMITKAYLLTDKSTRVGWVPHYHDLGLIFNAMQSCYVGSLCVIMAPVAFVQRPWVWLNAISRYRAEIAMAPNSAYDTCIDSFRSAKYTSTDLSHWKIAVNGAEPVRTETMQGFTEVFAPFGFRFESFHPGFGLAEATLVVSGGRFNCKPVYDSVDEPRLKTGTAEHATPMTKKRLVVGCGRPLEAEILKIIDPETRAALTVGEVGEIWVHGPHVAQGYWQNTSATENTFRATLKDDGDRYWLRTGDLGYLNNESELFITGRLKDLITIRGENYYPQDIEYTVENCHPALRRAGGAAFVDINSAGSSLIVAHEIKRNFLKSASEDDIMESIKRAVVQEHGLAVADIVLVRTGLIPKTTSGKIRRQHTYQLWKQGALTRISFLEFIA